MLGIHHKAACGCGSNRKLHPSSILMSVNGSEIKDRSEILSLKGGKIGSFQMWLFLFFPPTIRLYQWEIRCLDRFCIRMALSIAYPQRSVYTVYSPHLTSSKYHRPLVKCYVFFSCLFVFHEVFLHSPGLLGIHQIDKANLELRDLPAFASRVLWLKATDTDKDFIKDNLQNRKACSYRMIYALFDNWFS